MFEEGFYGTLIAIEDENAWFSFLSINMISGIFQLEAVLANHLHNTRDIGMLCKSFEPSELGWVGYVYEKSKTHLSNRSTKHLRCIRAIDIQSVIVMTWWSNVKSRSWRSDINVVMK